MRTTRRAIAITWATAAIALADCDTKPAAQTAAGSRADPIRSAPAATGDLSYQAIRELLGDPDDFARARKLGALLPTLGPGSIPAVKAALEDADTLQMGAVEFELFVRYWAAHDPSEAGWYALAKSPVGYRDAAVFAAVSAWAMASPQEAMEAVRPWSREGGDTGWAADIALVRGWYVSGKPGLEDYIRDLGAGPERQRALSAYAVAVIHKHGADAIAKWAEALPEDDKDYKLEAFRRVAEAMVPFDLAAATRFCDAHCEGPHGSNVRKVIAGRWALDDPGAALDWLSKGPDSQETKFAVLVTYSLWVHRNPDAAMAWMQEKLAGGEPPAWLESALPDYARAVGRKSPTEGLTWAAKLVDNQRYWVTIDIVRRWRRADESAAEAWMGQASLTPDQIERIRGPETAIERREQEEALKEAAREAAKEAAAKRVHANASS